MKKTILFVLSMIMACGAVEAKPVDVNTARRAGTAYLRTVEGVSGVKLTEMATPFSGFYVFSLGEEGFILVAGDDCVTPVLGYSLSGRFVVEGMPAHVRAWFDRCDETIRQLAQRDAAKGPFRAVAAGGNSVAAQWSRLLSGERPLTSFYTPVSPLLTTTWNQGPYYNALTPYDANESEYYGHRLVTGCVATATAQVMKYFNHPATGYGSHSYSLADYGTLSANFGSTTYQWSNMPNALTSASSSAQVNAVATLMYHVGVADEMSYGLSADGGSGAHNYNWDGRVRTSSQSSLMSFFKYRPDMAVISREDYSYDDYCALLRTELAQSRPILYSGRDESGGHSFVVDGYNAAGLFHVNWGWGGYCDAYYAIGGLVPGGGGAGANNGSYDLENVALTGIRPNTNWSTTGSTTFSATVTGGTASVDGTGSYSFGDTALLSVYGVPDGYRFAGWSDGDRFNPRGFIATGGSYSFTAQVEPMAGDTLSYCGDYCSYISSWSVDWNDNRWGIRFPSSVLTSGTALSAVQIFIPAEGNYTLTVYKGTTSPSTQVYTQSAYFSAADGEQWQTYTLSSPVAVGANEDIWISFTCSDVDYPAAVTSYSGNGNSILFGNQMTNYDHQYSFMIRGIFHTTSVVSGDTLSYCGNAQLETPINAGGNPFAWGIMLPASQLAGRNYLKSVMAYIPVGEAYTLNVYTGATAPGTLLHTQTRVFGDANPMWQEIALDATVAIPSGQNLWIFLTSTQGAACAYTGDTNSDWLVYNNQMMHLQNAGTNLNYSWMVKAVTSATAPALPAPTVYVDGPTTVAVGAPATFSATATAGATVSWSFAGATPSTATGATATATWSTPGAYSVIATATSPTGIGRDTLMVSVVACSTVSTFPFLETFDDPTTLACWTTVDADNDGYGWDYTTFAGYAASASYINNVGALTPDNWLVTPQLQLAVGATYKLSWKVAGTDVSYAAEHYGVFVSTTGTAPSNFTLIEQATLSSSSWVYDTVDLSAYAGQNIYVAFRHYSCTDQYWMVLDSVQVNELRDIYVDGDTISYVGNRPFAGGINAGGDPFYWGIMIPSSRLSGRNYLRAVNYFAGATGNYTLYVYSGGSSSPSTFCYTQSATATGTGWQTMTLDTTLAIASGQNLWIIMYSPVAAGASHSGSVNSDWLSLNGSEWNHITGYGYDYSWMLKAVTSATAPAMPAPQVTITGYDQVAVGLPISLNATATQGATVSWSLAGATPSTATGNAVTATWTTPGTYNVVATVSNTHGTGRDTLVMHVMDYNAGDTISYCLDRPFYTNVGTGNGDYFSWGIKIPAAYMTNRRFLNDVLLYVKEAGAYTMNIYQGSQDTVSGTRIYTKTFTFGTADTGRYNSCTPDISLSINPALNLWITFAAPAITYPAASCAFMGDLNSDWISFNDTNWMHVSSQIPSTWMIKAVTSATVTYTITAESANPAMGSVSGGGAYASGSSVTLTATAAEGHHFVQWQDGNTSNPRTVVVNGNATYTATFAVDSYAITVAANDPAYGYVTGGGTYEYMQPVTLTATAYTGYRFVRWSNGVSTTPYFFPAVESVSLTAIFQAEDDPTEYYTITVTSANPEMGSVAGGGVFAEGETATISATANSGYHFVQWQDGNTSNPRSVEVTADATYTATFEADTPVTGIDDIDEGVMPTLSPNPATSTVVLSLGDVAPVNGQVAILSLHGSVLATYRIEEPDLRIDVSALAAGTYFLRVSAADAAPVVLKLIKL